MYYYSTYYRLFYKCLTMIKSLNIFKIGRCYYLFHFTNKKTEAQGVYGTLPGPYRGHCWCQNLTECFLITLLDHVFIFPSPLSVDNFASYITKKIKCILSMGFLTHFLLLHFLVFKTILLPLL